MQKLHTSQPKLLQVPGTGQCQAPSSYLLTIWCHRVGWQKPWWLHMWRGLDMAWHHMCHGKKMSRIHIHREATSNTCQRSKKMEHKPDVFRNWAARKIAIIIAHTRKYGTVKPQNANNCTRWGTLSSVCIFDTAQKVAKWKNFLTGLNRDCSKATRRRYFNILHTTRTESSKCWPGGSLKQDNEQHQRHGTHQRRYHRDEKGCQDTFQQCFLGCSLGVGSWETWVFRPLSNRVGWRCSNFELILANQLN